MPQLAIAHTGNRTPVLPPRRAGDGMLSRRALTIETPRLLLRSSKPADPNVLDVAILLKRGLVEVGWLQFSLRDAREREVELGFFLEPVHRGCGLMREAARAAAPQALRLLGAWSLSALLPPGSEAAQKVARALGLVAAARRGSLQRFEKDLCGLI